MLKQRKLDWANMSNGGGYWSTEIAGVSEDKIVVRGHDLLQDLVVQRSFIEMFYLLLTGKFPNKGQEAVLNALFVVCAEHGISPSSTLTRFVQGAGVPIQCAVGVGAMGFGDIQGGAGEKFCREICDLVKRVNASGDSIENGAKQYVGQRKRIDGYGHPQHTHGDPRPPVLFELAMREGVAGPHIRMTIAIEREIELQRKRKIPVNIDGAVGAICADLGIDWRVSRACIVVPRTAGLFAHALEEARREKGWRQIPLEVISYDGPC